MTPRTKHMTLGAALGAAGTAIAIGLFHGRREVAAAFLPEHDSHEKRKHENTRGEYGRKKKHHHREH